MDTCWRCQPKPEVHTHTKKVMTGRVKVLKGAMALSESVPSCPLLPTCSPHSAPRRARDTTEDGQLKYWVIDTVSTCVWGSVDSAPKSPKENWCIICLTRKCMFFRCSSMIFFFLPVRCHCIRWGYWYCAHRLKPSIDSSKYDACRKSSVPHRHTAKIAGRIKSFQQRHSRTLNSRE